jgi:hypothetical protein
MTNNVAATILSQLGGRRRLELMMNAKDFVGDDNSLQFSIPSSTTINKANKVCIKLEADDTYTLKAYRFNKRTLECPQVGETKNNIYVENLHESFTALTGLHLKL